jgi:hypothetical protein
MRSAYPHLTESATKLAGDLSIKLDGLSRMQVSPQAMLAGY